MKYCTLKYDIIYQDGDEIHSEAPYRGESLDVENLVRFVKRYFAGPKAYDEKNLVVGVEEVYDDPREWLTVIRNWEAFKYLRNVNNFTGDLIQKYFPNGL